ncbi:MAG: hypothetical protein JXO22_08720 [Phycisphaerae bacterium]|nr:hypothetical protein [Phycisphaerae bacterium]
MTRSSTQALIVWATLAWCIAGASPVIAQISEPNEAPAAAITVPDLRVSEGHPLPAAQPSTESDLDADPADSLDLEKTGLVPEMSAGVRTWLAIVIILVLLLRLDPVLTLHNLDALVLAITCALLLSRHGELDAAPPWVYVALSLAAAYWLFRGLLMFARREIPKRQLNLTRSATLVLVAAGLLIAFDGLLRAPLSESSRDSIVGAVQVTRTGKLPYGIVTGHDARSPLSYIVHAGGVWLDDAGRPEGDRLRDTEPTGETPWLFEQNEFVVRRVALLVNGVLSLALLGALCIIGLRLHSPAMSGALVVLACVFPGATECFGEPEIMLPAVMLAWSVAFALLGGLGGLLSMLTLVLAGMAWPWAWCAVPVLGAYLLRRGLQVLGMIIGLLGGAVACVAGIIWLVAPDLPRVDGAMRHAGLAPAFVAQLASDGGLVIEKSDGEELMPSASPAIKQRFWRALLEFDNVTLDGLAGESMLPNGDDAAGILYREVVPEADAQERMVAGYRNALAEMDDQTRFWAATRTMLEATWLPTRLLRERVMGAWEFWSGRGGDDLWRNMRRGVKVGLAVLIVIVSLALLGGGKRQPHHLVGALLMIASATLLVSWYGAVTNWVWLLPLILATLIVHTEDGQEVRQAAVERPYHPATPRVTSDPAPPALDLGPAPRITVDKE